MSEIIYKKCNICKKELSTDKFPKSRYNKPTNKCKKCTTLYKMERKNILTPFINKECKECGTSFKTRSGDLCNSCRSKKYCVNKNIIFKICRHCGEEFNSMSLKAVFCSNKCQINSWRITNLEKYRELHRIGDRRRYLENINNRISRNIRSRFKKAVYKPGHYSINGLGCTIEELKFYLESKFLTGMTWSNYGLRGWHIDHIEPLSKFNLTDPEQVKIACHYSNLQPLWALDNIKKSNK